MAIDFFRGGIRFGSFPMLHRTQIKNLFTNHVFTAWVSPTYSASVSSNSDGTLSYGCEKIIETYYDFEIWKTVHGALDYQFVTDTAFNRDRGPVSVFAAGLHWSF